MGKSLPNYLTMEYYERTYLTKDYVIVDKNDQMSKSYKNNDTDRKNDPINNNKSNLEYIYDNIKFW